MEVLEMKKTKLNITFYNPNTVEGFAKELIKIAAEVAKAQVNDSILHIETANAVVIQKKSA